ncbi:MAG TPA: hypothetical protein VIA18_05650 [Polyangia bacterium]|jgi:SRSO17 transposase|nr:hypothetical protein [Polyangia bacterium]
MTQLLDGTGIERLEHYFDDIGAVLGDERRRASFAMYAMGLFGDGDRKSVEPMAARACGDPLEAERAHDRLCTSLQIPNGVIATCSVPPLDTPLTP